MTNIRMAKNMVFYLFIVVSVGILLNFIRIEPNKVRNEKIQINSLESTNLFIVIRNISLDNLNDILYFTDILRNNSKNLKIKFFVKQREICQTVDEREISCVLGELDEEEEVDLIVYQTDYFIQSKCQRNNKTLCIPIGDEEWKGFRHFGLISVKNLLKWKLPEISIHVITHDRPYSLERLLNSLSSSFFFGDKPKLYIHVDALPDERTMHLIKSFKWIEGRKELKLRLFKAGLLTNIVESWYPLSNNEFSIFLEDDIEVSPYFYLWSKMLILNYYETKGLLRKKIFGFSLYTPRVQELTFPKRKISFRKLVSSAGFKENSMFLYQNPCSWGAVYFPEIWKEFFHYISSRLNSANSNTIIPNARSNTWKNSWKKYFIEMIVLRGYLMVYPNFINETSFSTNHVEIGQHINVNNRNKLIAEFEVPLINADHLSDLTGRLPSLSEMPIFDLFNNYKNSIQEIIEYGIKLSIGWKK
jgi:hypothetical protein